MERNQYKYFAVSGEDVNWGIHILDCGSLFSPPGSKSLKTSHPNHYQMNWEKGRTLQEYQLIYLIEGEGIFEGVSSGKLLFKKGSLILLYPGEWHRYKSEKEKEWNTYWIGFNGAFADQLVSKLGFTPDNPIKWMGYQSQLVNSYIEIIGISQTEFAGYQQVLAGEVMKLFGWIHAFSKKSEFKEKNVDSIIQSAKLLLIADENESGIENIAEELNLGYSKFRKMFKDYTGMSPGQFRMQHKLQKARGLLMSGELSIKEIAYTLGFETTQYFTKVFKNKTGKTPAGFRRLNM